MKILHIDTGKEWRGGQRQALFLHEGLLEYGIESIIVCNAHGQLCRKNINGIVPVTFKGEADLSFLSELKRIIKEFQPDIVHTHDAHSLTPALFAKVTGRSFRLINTRRVDFSINKGFISRKKYNNDKVDRVVAISEAIKDMLIKDGVKPEKVPVINSGVRFPNSINYSKVLELREKYEITPETYIVGCVANIADHKDHKVLLSAYDKFYRVVGGTKLILVGDGPLMEEIREFSETLESRSSIIFTGYSDYVYEHIALFDIFCMSSKTEGLCTSIIDAFFMGRPVIATRAGGIPELVKHKFNGLLSDVGDIDEFAENLLEIYDDMPMENKFSANGYHTALKFSDGGMVSKYINLYKELLSGR
ncbi:glycosyl transferase group 1 [Denitrovibrio acetiphilus DSM 12809]|uniref:Glycosyl transferase group 1 n=1 Tax=Denitrovibrio acetiphilus (strain DSM 12809 / NBRC 114555 / N2460) TaxID=522772 RepID=D4H814_DENA2|nr:glycosyltransferase [Denitrovibrio acetiphilus]ADD68163.1 glycosyl transferase group 1 [Denitrovibrio acetiphilus DSM 12809]